MRMRAVWVAGILVASLIGIISCKQVNAPPVSVLPTPSPDSATTAISIPVAQVVYASVSLAEGRSLESFAFPKYLKFVPPDKAQCIDYSYGINEQGRGEYAPEEQYVRHYSVRFLDKDGKPLLDFPFTRDFTTAYRTGGHQGCTVYMTEPHAYFCRGFAFPERMAKLQFLREGKVVAEKIRSPFPPQLTLGHVKILADGRVRLPWKLSNRDDNELRLCMGLHTPDSRNSDDAVLKARGHLLADNVKIALSPGPRDEGHTDSYMSGPGVKVTPEWVEFDGSRFQGGKDCWIEADVCDGLNNVPVRSEKFELPIRVIHVKAVPAESAAYLEGDRLYVGAYPADHVGSETRRFYRYEWRCEHDGQHSNDDYLTHVLSAGIHKITVTATARDGKTSRDTISITASAITHDALPVLMRLLHSKELSDRTKSVQAMLKLELSAEEFTPVIRLLTQSAPSANEMKDRYSIAGGLERNQDKALFELFVDLLAKNRAKAASATSALITVMGNTDDARVSKKCSSALAAIGSPALPAVLAALHDDKYAGRHYAARTLGKMGQESAIPDLQATLSDPDEEVRSAAVEAIETFGARAKSAIPLLEKMAKVDPSAACRTKAKKVLEYFHH